MRELWLVVKREFDERVRTRAFVVGTFVFPLFMAAVMILPDRFQGSEQRSLVVVDEAPAGVADRFTTLLGDAGTDGTVYRLETVPGPLEERRAELTRRLAEKAIDGFVVLPADILKRDTILYRANAVASPRVVRDLGLAATHAVQAERLRQAGLGMEEVSRLVARVTVDNARITAEGEERGSPLTTLWAAYIVSFAIYMLVAFYGMSVMRSVLHEKTNRIAEVLVSSMKSTHLLAGKIIGVGSAALLQVGIWAAAGVIFMTQADRLGGKLAMDPKLLRAAIAMDAGSLVALLAFFILGFFLYAALFAALGAAVTTDQEAQSFQMVLMVPLFVPLLLLISLSTDPLGSVATFLGILPFTAPIAMPIRMASVAVPALQIIGSLVLLALALVVVAWLAGKIYRIGVLATGKRPSAGELVRWIRMP